MKPGKRSSKLSIKFLKLTGLNNHIATLIPTWKDNHSRFFNITTKAGRQRIMITYEKQAITIKIHAKGTKGEVAQEMREAMVAIDIGLAYFSQVDSDDNEIVYSVIHVGSGLNVCKGRYASSEQEAQAWIAGLLELADWSGEMPRLTAPLTQLMRYAIIGVLHEPPLVGEEKSSQEHSQRDFNEQQEDFAPSSLSLVRARHYLKHARQCAGDAYRLFAPYTSFDGNIKPEREKFVDAIDWLRETEQAVQLLRAVLFSDTSLPNALLEKLDWINAHIDTVVEQIKKKLIPSLNRNEIGDFSELQTALQQIYDLFPRETPSKDQER
jgi:hypothetical protein